MYTEPTSFDSLFSSMILVSGATGFIGRRLIRRLAEIYEPSQIICLVYDKADSELEKSGRALLDGLGIRYIPIDLLTGRGLENIPKNTDLVFHLAADTDTGTRDHSVNDVGTKNLLEALQPLKTQCRFIFTSTIAVSDHRASPDEPGNETSELLKPYSEYGRRKLLTEDYLKARCREDGFSLSILRVCAVYGKGTRTNGLFDALMKLAKRDSILSRFDYPGRMTMMHVDDIADILVGLSELPANPGNPSTCIAEAEVLSVHEMHAAIHKALGKTIRPIRLPRWFWRLTEFGSSIIYALEPVLPHSIHNKLWQLTLLVNNGYNNVSLRLKEAFPQKVFKRFENTASSLWE